MAAGTRSDDCHTAGHLQVLDAEPDVSDRVIKLGRNTGIPLGVVGGRRAAAHAAALNAAVADDGAAGHAASNGGYCSPSDYGGGGGGGFIPVARRKGETALERRARKADVKEAQVPPTRVVGTCGHGLHATLPAAGVHQPSACCERVRRFCA